MSFRIMSGTGNGKEAVVDSNNRIGVAGVTESLADHATDFGQRYNINSGPVTLTTDGESAVLYIKNNEEYDYVITKVIYNLGPSTGGGTNPATMDIYFKTTGGTIVSGATDADVVVNQNLGSANTLTADVYKGAEGNTQTGGILADTTFLQPNSRGTEDLGKIIVPKGQAVSFTVTPPTSNTSMAVKVDVEGYVSTPDVIGGL